MLIGIFYSQIVESSSLVSVLFREAISHPYISFFHLLVNGFSVTCIYMLSVCLVCQINCVGGVTWTKHAHAQSFLGGGGAVKPVTPVLFISYTLEL